MTPYLSAANQKVFFARQLLQWAVQDVSDHQRRAACEGALMHLVLGYRFHLQEIAETYHCRQPAAVSDAANLCDALEAVNKAPAEAEEIRVLLAQPGSWLYQMLDAYQELMAVPEQRDRDKPSDNGGLVVVNISDEAPEVTAITVQDWLQRLVEMFDRHRDAMVEY